MSEDLQKFMNTQPCALPVSWYIASPYSHEDPEIKIQREADAKRAESFISQGTHCLKETGACAS